MLGLVLYVLRHATVHLGHLRVGSGLRGPLSLLAPTFLCPGFPEEQQVGCSLLQLHSKPRTHLAK